MILSKTSMSDSAIWLACKARADNDLTYVRVYAATFYFMSLLNICLRC